MANGTRFVQLEIFYGLGRSAEPILLRLKAQGILEGGLAALGKQRVTGYVRKTVQLQQAILRITVAFERSPASDVHGCNRTRYQRRTNQHETMTMQRIFLGTHPAHSLPLA